MEGVICHVSLGGQSHVSKYPSQGRTFETTVTIECWGLALNFNGFRYSSSEVIFLPLGDYCLFFLHKINTFGVSLATSRFTHQITFTY